MVEATAVPQPAVTPVVPVSTPGPASLYPDLPVGFPVDPSLQPMRVLINGGIKRIADPAPDGPTILEVASEIQTHADNNEFANQYGWNCRVHERHEEAPAVDWYLPEGTPLYATMRGQAELYFITTSNAFEYYGVDLSSTLGLPSPHGPLFPLPGPGGGMGVFVSIVNGDLRAEYGHLEWVESLAHIETEAFIPPFSPNFDYESRFGAMRNHYSITMVATWPVEEGDIVGFVGNTGYSDVAHVHYQVLTRDRTWKFCPTYEPYPSNGWLFEPPAEFLP